MEWKKAAARTTCTALAAAMLMGTAVLSVPAADTASADTQAETDVCTGGWEINASALSVSKQADAKAAFEKAAEALVGVDYAPVSLLGTQCVAGTNYCFLAKSTVVYPGAETEYVLVYIYEDLEQNAEITGIYSLSDTIGVGTGGWEFQQGKASVNAHKALKKTYKQAVKKAAKKTGDTYVSAAYVATNGKKDCVLCRVTTASGAQEIRLVYLKKNAKGTAKITWEKTVDIAALWDEAQ